MNTRRTLLACCIAGALAAPLARAGESVDKTLEAAEDGVVEIENVRGEIDVKGWDRKEVHIEGEIDDLAEELVFRRDGSRTVIDVKLPDDNIDSGDGSTLTVRVPMKSRVELRSISASSTVSEIEGGLSLRTVSGDIKVDKVKGDLSIKTVSGEMRIAAGGGGTQLKTVSGDMELHLDSRSVDLSTVSGDVQLDLGEFDDLIVNSVSGDLHVRGALARNGRIECKTVSGTCELGLRGKIDARVNARTGPGGEIINGLNSVVPEEEFPAQQSLDTTVGDGSGSISASTVSGEIHLERD